MAVKLVCGIMVLAASLQVMIWKLKMHQIYLREIMQELIKYI